ncbi:diguanylate cyclase (GGDEF) domain-containing protein [Halopseudomonas xinjiangensis]|uniref:Diguanylate cyclase (GGDEF) domain-containing protein n=1 Tax=Halopseudomonas xinjiangensis TaxID=487184 RepID=A0A1H1LE37_9GAMM|nr:EAL domain-containing protein [Halopseudomonas xinjiangensis]SDR72149.1 diguanylate cyclase (GGDEF) domain-containing protein [Halopseudomonas xinjiangensis]
MGTNVRKLLLVEADPDKREHLLSLCRQPPLASFEVDICTQPREAVHRVAQNTYFACLLPNDLSLLQDARRVASETLYLLISEGGDARGDSRAIEQGADEVLVRTNLDADQINRALIHGQLRRDGGSKLERQAKQDPLTGLGNRAMLEEELDRLLIKGKRSGFGFALLYIDLDYFKQINDSFGHGLGDLLLAVIANRLRRTMRQEDLIARIGGDEFVALLQDVVDANDAALIASKIIHTLSEPITLSGHHLLISASVGIAMYPQHGQSATELLHHGDQALYRAKANGRNGYSFFNPDEQAQTRHNLDIEQGLRHGLLEGQFRLHYQPIVDTRNGDTVSWEALLRWQHPQLGLLAPDAFLKLAEHSGLILPMGHWVISQALEAVKAWRAAGVNCRLSINLSDRELKQPRFADQLRQLLANSKVPPGMVQLELREDALLKHAGQAAALCESLSALGVDIWLDHFGAEYGALGYLTRLPIKGIKLDTRELTSEAETDHATYLRNLIKLARSLDKQVTANYVEDAQSAEQLSSWGGDFLQGYWIGKPRPLDDLLSQSSSLSST